MPIGKVSMQAVLNDIRENGGIGASVEFGYPHSAMPNDQLAMLWMHAEDALSELCEYLGIEGGPDGEDA